MLATALWFVIVLALLAGVLADVAATFGRATLHAAADHAVEPAMHDAVASFQNALGQAIAQAAISPSSGTPFAGAPPAADGYPGAIANLPAPLQGTLAANAGTGNPAPGFTVAYAVTPTTVTAPSCTSPSSGPDVVARLQCGGFVRESRMSLRVDVSVLDASGAVVAQRRRTVTLRLFADPPYSAVAGSSDAAASDPVSADALAPVPHEGDVAGDATGGATPIHVRYECHDGAGSCVNAAPPDPDAAARANVPWTNGN